MWFELKGDARLGRCATDRCGGAPTFRLEADGVASNYCSGCRANIAQHKEDVTVRLTGIATAIGLDWTPEYRQQVFDTVIEARTEIEWRRAPIKAPPELEGVLAFLNKIEGDGYGGMATFEAARADVICVVSLIEKLRSGVVTDEMCDAGSDSISHDDGLKIDGDRGAWLTADGATRVFLAMLAARR